MKLERARKMSHRSQEEDEELGLSREERMERRQERRRRRAARKARRIAKRETRRDERLARKAEKLRQKAEKLEEKSERLRDRGPGRRRRDEDEPAEAAPRRRRVADDADPRRPAPGRPRPERGDRDERSDPRRPDRPALRSPVDPRQAVEDFDLEVRRPHHGHRPDGILPDEEYVDWIEEAPPLEPFEASLEPLDREDLGWSFPAWRRAQERMRHPLQRPHVIAAHPPSPVVVSARQPAPRVVAAHQPSPPAPWSQPARMSPHLRIQAATGHRAAVIELKPGLFVVADVPDALARPEVGFAPLLAPLMIRAASRSMARREARAAASLEPQLVHREPLALPGPVADEVRDARVAGWADAEDLAGVLAEASSPLPGPPPWGRDTPRR